MAHHSLGSLVTVKSYEGENSLADSQPSLMHICDTGVLLTRCMDSQKVFVMRDEHSTLPESKVELLEIGSPNRARGSGGRHFDAASLEAVGNGNGNALIKMISDFDWRPGLVASEGQGSPSSCQRADPLRGYADQSMRDYRDSRSEQHKHRRE